MSLSFRVDLLDVLRRQCSSLEVPALFQSALINKKCHMLLFVYFEMMELVWLLRLSECLTHSILATTIVVGKNML